MLLCIEVKTSFNILRMKRCIVMRFKVLRRIAPLVVTGCVSALPHARVCTHYFARYLTVTVKIQTLGRNSPVALTGSLVWWDSP